MANKARKPDARALAPLGYASEPGAQRTVIWKFSWVVLEPPHDSIQSSTVPASGMEASSAAPGMFFKKLARSE